MNPDQAMLAQDNRGHFRRFFLGLHGPDAPTIERAEGLYFWDSLGRRYIDTTSGPVTCNLGHGNAAVLDAMTQQAQKACFAWPVMFKSEANLALSESLSRLAGPGYDCPFVVSGGSEAVESALKFARQYAIAKGEPSRWKVISRHPAYHGGTLGAAAVSGDEIAQEIFGPMMQAMPKVPAPFTYRLEPGETPEERARSTAQALAEEIERQGPETVAAFIMEPIGGLATGALVAADLYYRQVREICDRYGLLLIYDEVMSGAGRSGRFLAAHHWPDAQPDLVVLAKGVGAGFTPLGLMLASSQMVDAVAAEGGFLHGHTYNANPLTCAVGHAVLQETERLDLIANTERMGTLLMTELRAIMAESPIVGDVRGRGLLQAIELVADKETKEPIPMEHNVVGQICALGMEEGLAIYSRVPNGGKFGQWLMMTPPLIVNEEQVHDITTRLAKVLTRCSDGLARNGLI